MAGWLARLGHECSRRPSTARPQRLQGRIPHGARSASICLRTRSSQPLSRTLVSELTALWRQAPLRRRAAVGTGWAAAVFCARYSMVARIGLVGRLARAPSPRWRPRARSPLPLCSCALRRVLVSPQGSGSWQGATTSLQFLHDIDPPVHGKRATTARPRLHP